MIPVVLDQLLFSNMGFVVLLKGEGDERVLPIFIGTVEARAIALYNNKVQVPRPLTHDLMKNLLDFMECTIKRIEVHDLREGTFIARLIIEKDGVESEIDSRPSDAIALALLTSVPMYVDEKVMDEAGRVMEGFELEKEKKTVEQEKTFSPLEALKKDLQEAVEEERYEDAARIKKEIDRIENEHSDN
jgi:bifunctional DNase/RNase